MGKLVGFRIEHPVLVVVGWLAFVAGHALTGLPILARLGFLAAARVLPSALCDLWHWGSFRP